MEAATKFNDFFTYGNFFFNTMGIRLFGDDVESSKRKRFLFYLLFLVQAFNLDLWLLAGIIFVVLAFMDGDKFIEATMVMSYLGFVSVVNIKMFFVWKKIDLLTEFFNRLKELFPTKIELQRKYYITKYYRECKRLALGFSILYMALIWTYNLIAIFQLLFLGMERSLPYLTFIPWDWKNHWSYYLIYIFQNLAGYSSGAGQIGVDLLLVSCGTQLIMHFDYVYYSLVDYESKVVELRGTQGELAAIKEDMRFLRNISKYHANLLETAELINHIFEVPLLLNFISSTFVICFIGFQITIGASPGTVVQLLLFFISSTAQVYLVCHYSQRLIDVSTNVANAVYNQNWTQADVRYQKSLILIAQRAQIPMQLKATTFVNISRATVSEIMQMSYKFLTLLRTMYSD